jgi:hypothetical protein
MARKNRYNIGETVILNDGTLAKITGARKAFDEVWYEVEPLGAYLPMKFDVIAGEINGKA